MSGAVINYSYVNIKLIHVLHGICQTTIMLLWHVMFQSFIPDLYIYICNYIYYNAKLKFVH